MRQNNHASGFGIIELAVVIIILGGIFVMTLKGTLLVEQVRASITRYQIQQLQMKVQGYFTEFNNRLPGDDAGAPQRWNRDLSTFSTGRGDVSFMGDGVMQGDLADPLNVNGEQYMAWRDLRFAGMLDGDPELRGESARPENIFGGFFAFAERNLGLSQVLCATTIPGRAAQSIDEALDDGNVATGNLRGTSQWDPVGAKNQFDAPDDAPYNPEKTYIICLPFMP